RPRSKRFFEPPFINAGRSNRRGAASSKNAPKSDYCARHDMQNTVKRLLKRLTDLGYPVQPASPS
ncbi:hypothetical protein CA601_46505, partial [Paraburkholderia hospita]